MEQKKASQYIESGHVGFSILQNLGLSEDVVVEPDTEIKVRPQGAGLNPEIDGYNTDVKLLKPIGAWKMDNSKNLPTPPDRPLPSDQSFFCVSQSLPKFQAALCKYHLLVQKYGVNSEIRILHSKASELSQKIESLRQDKKQAKIRSSTRNDILNSIQSVLDSPDNYDSAYDVALQLSKTPAFISKPNKTQEGYQTRKSKDKETFSAKKVALFTANNEISNIFSSPTPFSTKNNQTFLHIQQRLMEIGNAHLWLKFVSKTIMIFVENHLNLETQMDITTWITSLLESGIFCRDEIQLFFSSSQSFLINNLDKLCTNFSISNWLSLSADAQVSSQFSAVVRAHASFILTDFSTPKALQLIKLWPKTLGTSVDFLQGIVCERLAPKLKFGNIDAISILNPWVEILPVDLLARLIATSYLQTHFNLIKKGSPEEAMIYCECKKRIPFGIRKHPRIIKELANGLAKLKSNNSALIGLRLDEENNQRTIEDLLSTIARNQKVLYMPKGTIEGRAAYQMGKLIVGVFDKVLYVRREQVWVPIMIRDLTQELSNSLFCI